MLAKALEKIEVQAEDIWDLEKRMYGLQEYVAEMKLQLESLKEYSGVPIDYCEITPSRRDAANGEPPYVTRMTLTKQE